LEVDNAFVIYEKCGEEKEKRKKLDGSELENFAVGEWHVIGKAGGIFGPRPGTSENQQTVGKLIAMDLQ
jgi:hypothetical protein